MNKKGFTLIEVIVSVVLVSVIMVSLMASLIQLRKTYTLIHENSDILVYSSSIARVINNDLTKNNGIRYISCNESRKQCDMILGNDERRQIIIQEETTDMGTNESHVTGTNVKTTLRYINNTEEDNLKLVYIRTLELDRYSKNGKVTTEGYNFLDMTYNQTEYSEDVTSLLMDVYTTLVIRLYNGIEEDVSSYNVTLYTAGRYDESSRRGKIYTVNFDSSGATTVGTKSVDEVFGVGYFVSDSNHTVSDRVYKIDIPTRNDGKVFLGYYYYNPSWPSGRQEEVIVDGEGRIVATSYFFKEDVANSLGDETILRVYAKWGDCKNGYELGENGRCVAKNCRVVLDFNDTPATGVRGTKTYYDIKYLSRIPDLNEATELPTKGGYTFTGYTLSSTQYHNNKGKNSSNIINMNYNDASGKCITLKAGWQACPVGYYSLESESTCSKCAVGSIASTTGTTRCTPCSGKTTGSDAANTCNQDCANKAHANNWKAAKWDDSNKVVLVSKPSVSGICKISTCDEGYHLVDEDTENNKCVITNPATPTISGGTTKIYGSGSVTLTCATTTNYVSGTNKYYSFGYSTTDGGTPSNWTSATTSSTLTIGATDYTFDRYYSCRIYASDGTTKFTSATITSLSSADALVRFNNAKITFDATTNSGVLDGTNTLYTRTGQKKFFTEIRNSTEGTIPVAKRAGYKFNGWYTQASGGTQIIKPDRSVPNNITITSDTTLYAQFGACPAGTWNDGTKTTCTNCVAGTASNRTGQTSSSTCVACSAGKYSGAGAPTCSDCPSGTYQPNTGQSSCINCAAGTASSDVGRTTACPACTPGKYASGTGNTYCPNCPGGTYSSGTGNTYCTECPAGRYAHEGAISCGICAKGTYSKARATDCTKCAAGTYQDVTGQSSCKNCSAGTYASGTGNTSCKVCSAGSYASGTGNASCKKCPAGTYQTNEGKSSCTKCAAGTASNTEGKSTACPGCPSGKYASGLGNKTCSNCAAGTYSGPSASSCTNCASNHCSRAGSSSCVIKTYCTTTNNGSSVSYGGYTYRGPGTARSTYMAAGCQAVSGYGGMYYPYTISGATCR